MVEVVRLQADAKGSPILWGALFLSFLNYQNMKKVLKLTAWVIGIIAVTVGIIFLVAWKSPKYYTLQQHHQPYPYLPFKAYNGEHPRPYIIEKNNVLVFGAAHTRDPKDKEIGLIEEKWKAFKPTVALVEGRLGFLLPGVMDPVENLGEGGKVKALAHRDDVPLYNWDLSKEALARQMRAKFSAEQIAIAQILNPYFSQMRFGKPASPETFVDEYLKRAAYVGLQDSIKTVQDVDRIWQKYFPGKDWRDVTDEYGLPGYLGEMMTTGNDLRNQQLVAAIKELTARGERVFVICGSSHAVCVAPAL